MNQCDTVEKSPDWDMEDLVKVCPGTRHCKMGIIPALLALPALWMTVKTAKEMTRQSLPCPCLDTLTSPCPHQRVSLHSCPSADGDLLLWAVSFIKHTYSFTQMQHMFS